MNKIGCYRRGGLLIGTFVVVVATTIIGKLPINVTWNIVKILNFYTRRITLSWPAGCNLCAQLCRNNNEQQSDENTLVDFNWFHIVYLFFDIVFNIFN